MVTENLVLLKPRRHRLAEMIIVPLLTLPVGPVLRALLGPGYHLFHGLVAIFLINLLCLRLSKKWAARHGGQWVTKAEQLQRQLDDARQAPWRYALSTALVIALTLLGLMLVINPLDHFGETYGGPLVSGLTIALVALLTGARVLLTSRVPAPIVVDQPPPTGHYGAELAAVLPRLYLACGLGAAAALLAAKQLPSDAPGSMPVVVFVAVFLMVSQLLQMLFLRQRGGQRIYLRTPDIPLSRQMTNGILLWGIPMAMMFAGLKLIDWNAWGQGIEGQLWLILWFGLTSVIGGSLFGVLFHITQRMQDGRRSR